MKLNKIVLVSFFLILVLSVYVFSEDIKNKYGGIKTEDSDNIIEIELDITGLNPTKEYATIDIKNIGRKLSGKLNDIILISPIPLYNIHIDGSKAKTQITDYVYTCSGSSYGYIDTTHFFCNTTFTQINNITLESTSYDTQHIEIVPVDSQQKVNEVTWSSIDSNYKYNDYTCTGSSYGYIDNTHFYCNHTYTQINNITLENTSYDIQDILSITDNNKIEDNKIIWYDRSDKLYYDKTSKDIKLKTKVGFTNYGLYQYYIEAEEFIATAQDSYTIKVTPYDFGLLPIKYTICMGDVKDQTTWFCLDPTITDSRTWTTDADFTNGTILSNMTTSNNQLEISNSLLYYNQGFEGSSAGAITCDVQSITGAGTFEYVTTGCRTGSVCLKYSQTTDQYNAQTGVSACAINTSYKISPTNSIPYNITYWIKTDYTGAGGGYGTGIFIRNSSNMVHTGIYAHITSGFNLYNETLRAGARLSNFMGYTSARNNDWNMFQLLVSGDCVNISHYSSSLSLIENKSCMSRPSDVWETANLYFGLGGYAQQASQPGTYFMYDDLLIQRMNFTPQSQLLDRQGWTPQTGNTLTNLSAVVVTTGTSTVKFRYNTTNASLDTSAYTTLSTNGTNDLTFNLNANNPIFYEFLLQDTSGTETPKITSYTINEANLVTDTCTYSSGVWTIQSADSCNIITNVNMATNKIIFNGTGHTHITSNITSCGEVTIKGGAEVTISGGGRLC